jgi:hypothetical protein
LVSELDKSEIIVCVDLPTSTTSDCDQYNAYVMVVLELPDSVTAVLRLYFAIDPD